MAKVRHQPPSPASRLEQTVAPYRVRLAEPTIHMLAPGEIADHPLQHKAHPPQQREAMAALCREIGIAGVLLVYRSPGNAGQLTAIDGHLRKSLDPHQPWPCVLLDVDDDEAAYLLLTHDEIGRLAELLRQQTQTLLAQVSRGEGAVQDLLAQLREREGLLPDGTPAAPVVEVEPELDRVEALRAQYGVEVGQLWHCGRHRVLCGDCLQQETVTRLLAETSPQMVYADPPYGVQIVAPTGFVGGGEAYNIPFGGVQAPRRRGHVGGGESYKARHGHYAIERRGTDGAAKPFGSKAVRGTDGAAQVVDVGKYAPIQGD